MIQGRLVDAASDQPVGAAVVQLLRGEAGEQVAARGVSDEQGRFQVRAPEKGTYRLRLTRVGYQPVITRPIELVHGDEPLHVEVRISAVAVVLEPLTVVGAAPPRPRSPRLRNAGYYERKQWYGREGLGMGEFLDQEEIRGTHPSQVSDVLRTVRGVWVQGVGGRRQTITLRARGPGGRCVPQVYVDRLPAATGADIDDLVSPWSVAAIEVYPGLTVPAEFWRSGATACGVIVLWTGYGGPDTTEPERAAVGTDQELVQRATQLSLHIAIARDSVTLGETLWVTIRISNLSDSTRSLCVVESHLVMRGPETTRDIVERRDGGACLRHLDLAPQASQSWQEPVTIDAGSDVVGDVLIQKHLRIRYHPCGDGDACDAELRSPPHLVALQRDERS